MFFISNKHLKQKGLFGLEINIQTHKTKTKNYHFPRFITRHLFEDASLLKVANYLINVPFNVWSVMVWSKSRKRGHYSQLQCPETLTHTPVAPYSKVKIDLRQHSKSICHVCMCGDPDTLSWLLLCAQSSTWSASLLHLRRNSHGRPVCGLIVIP